MEFRLKPTWDWLLTVMDATEAQLKFGASLTNTLDSSNPGHTFNTGISTGGGQRNQPANTLASLGSCACLCFISISFNIYNLITFQNLPDRNINCFY